MVTFLHSVIVVVIAMVITGRLRATQPEHSQVIATTFDTNSGSTCGNLKLPAAGFETARGEMNSSAELSRLTQVEEESVAQTQGRKERRG